MKVFSFKRGFEYSFVFKLLYFRIILFKRFIPSLRTRVIFNPHNLIKHFQVQILGVIVFDLVIATENDFILYPRPKINMNEFKIFCADCKTEYVQSGSKPVICGACGSNWIAVKQIKWADECECGTFNCPGH